MESNSSSDDDDVVVPMINEPLVDIDNGLNLNDGESESEDGDPNENVQNDFFGVEDGEIIIIDSESEDGDPNENVQNDFFGVEDDEIIIIDSDDDERNSHGSISNGEDEPEPPQEFDHQLPSRHIYLGNEMEELHGRVTLEENSILEIPIVGMNFYLLPGQTLPMTVFHSVFQNAIRRCITNERVFGVVNGGIESIDGRTVISRGAIGTLAEIYEFQEESDNPSPNPLELNNFGHNFALKAKGRERFNVIEVRRQGDGNLMAKVKIRPEIKQIPLLIQITSNNTTRYQFPNSKSEDSQLMDNQSFRRYNSALTPWPSFVYENYDEKSLVNKIHNKLRSELKGLSESGAVIPNDPTDLSFWLAINLTMDDTIRYEILKLDSPIQRLRLEYNLLQNVSGVITCRRCYVKVGDQVDIFAMSTEGPQGTYVNPNGYIHETLTITKTNELITRGFPSTVASWFQGYSWTIVECRGCRSHLGWKFKALQRIKPRKFWGLARKAVTFKYDFGESKNIIQNPQDTTPQLDN